MNDVLFTVLFFAILGVGIYAVGWIDKKFHLFHLFFTLVFALILAVGTLTPAMILLFVCTELGSWHLQVGWAWLIVISSTVAVLFTLARARKKIDGQDANRKEGWVVCKVGEPEPYEVMLEGIAELGVRLLIGWVCLLAVVQALWLPGIWGRFFALYL